MDFTFGDFEEALGDRCIEVEGEPSNLFVPVVSLDIAIRDGVHRLAMQPAVVPRIPISQSRNRPRFVSNDNNRSESTFEWASILITIKS